MIRIPSLAGRLLAIAAVSITAALLTAGIVISFILHQFVKRTIDERLDTQIVFLASTLQSDGGKLSLSGNADGPPFDRPGRGWYWQVRGPNNVLRAKSLRDGTLVVSVPTTDPPPPPVRRGVEVKPVPPRSAEGPGPDGGVLYFRSRTVPVQGMEVEIVAAAPRAEIRDPLVRAMVPVGLCLVALEIVLLLAILLQVRVGLRPLARLRIAIADIRTGRSERLPSKQPSEVRPLVDELNALLEQNATTLERARRHVSNLAHGLKTPLATLAIALSRDKETNRELGSLVDTMDRQIRHHLGRARSAALAGPVRAQTAIAPRLEALAAVLSKINGSRRISFSVGVAANLACACEQQDFDEIAGNLLENAATWAKEAVSVQAHAAGHDLIITIDDDGPGLKASDVDRVLKPGQRLDEQMPGFGFGLSIARDLVDLYGGNLEFLATSRGGLRVKLTLPRANDTSSGKE